METICASKVFCRLGGLGLHKNFASWWFWFIKRLGIVDFFRPMKILKWFVGKLKRLIGGLEMLGNTVRWIFLLRVPFFSSLMVLGLPFAVLTKTGPSSLIEGAYDTSGYVGFGFLVLTLSFLVGCFFAITEGIEKCAPERYKLTPEASNFPKWLRTALGFLYYIGPVCSVAVCLHLAFSGDGTLWSTRAIRYLIAGCLGIVVPAALHRLTHNWVSPGRMDGRFPLRLLLDLFAVMGEGYHGMYLVADNSGKSPEKPIDLGRLHVRMTVFAALSLTGFLILAIPDCQNCPAALYVLLALLASSWILGAVCFFWDRFRVPLLTVTALWVMILSMVWRNDYTFSVKRVKSGRDGPCDLPDAGQVLGLPSLSRRSGDPPYLGLRPGPGQGSTPSLGPVGVAAVGGGIHSGAWAVEVLTRLQELDGCSAFPDKITALSGTSGGAYGAMLYAHAMYPYRHDRADKVEKLQKLREVVQASSLSAVVKELTYHDLAGYWLPLSGNGDRGSAMGRAWVKNAEQAWGRPGTPGAGGTDLDREISKPLDEQTLWDWAIELRAGKMPAVLFTSGTEETGRPIVFGNSKVFDWNFNAKQAGVKERQDSPAPVEGYPLCTVDVVTGARLSAAFPWVSPAAMPKSEDGLPLRRYEHQLDGGYYDNYGLLALNRWMDEGLNATLPPRRRSEGGARPSDCELAWVEDGAIRRILFIQIRYLTPFEEPISAKKGFFSQLIAPLRGLYNARVAGQRLRADEQFQLFSSYWKLRNVIVENVVFEYGAGDPSCTDKIKKEGVDNYIDKLLGMADQEGLTAMQEGDEKAFRKQETKQEKQEARSPVSSPLSWHLTSGNKVDITIQGKEIGSQYPLYVERERAILADERFSPTGAKVALARLSLDLPLGAAAARVQRFITGVP